MTHQSQHTPPSSTDADSELVSVNIAIDTSFSEHVSNSLRNHNAGTTKPNSDYHAATAKQTSASEQVTETVDLEEHSIRTELLDTESTSGEHSDHSEEAFPISAVGGIPFPRPVADGPSLGSLMPGTSVGRYVLEELLGTGGMGVVYHAHDPDLDRKLALKLLRVKAKSPRAWQQARRRIEREAKALAQLSHPNVIAVYDVGTWRDSVYIAMELVEGPTLQEWLAKEKRPLRDICEVFLAAGHGLAAAHRAGLIHRDFKPSNVIIGEDGRARILDFGLARAAGRENPTSPPENIDTPAPSLRSMHQYHMSNSERSLEWLDEQLTVQGTVMGTPAYMSPEQHCGDSVDARSDQFAFCASLYRAVYGKRPFAGNSVNEIRDNVLEGNISPTPPEADVPIWLERILLKGLSIERGDRYQTLDHLLVELNEHLGDRRQTRMVALAAALAALLLIGTFFFALASSDDSRQAALCDGGEDRLAKVWNSESKDAIHRAFVASGRAHGEQTYQNVTTLLDAYGQEWVDTRAQVCKAMHDDSDQDRVEFDNRMLCFSKRLHAMERLTNIFIDPASDEVVDKAITGVHRLPSIVECAQSDSPLRSYPLPSDKAQQDEIAAIEDKLETVETLSNTGQEKAALTIAEEMVTRADALSFLPLQSRANYLLAQVQDDIGAVKDAENSLHRAARAAAQARDDDLMAKIWTKMLWVVGYGQGRYDDAFALRTAAEIAVERAGNDPRLLAEILSTAGVLYDRMGNHHQAYALQEQALELASAALGENSPDLKDYVRRVGVSLARQGNYEEALIYQKREIDIITKHYGPNHVLQSGPIMNLGITLRRQQKHEESLKYLRRALELEEGNRGSVSRTIGFISLNIGSQLGDLGKYDEAQQAYQRALENNLQVFGPDNPMVGHAYFCLGKVLLDQGNYEESQTAIDRALAIYEHSEGLDHLDYGLALFVAGRIAAGSGMHARAEEIFRRVIDIRTKASGAKHPSTIETQIELARTLQRQSKYDAAESLLRGVLEVLATQNHKHEADALKTLGEQYLMRSDLDKAGEYLERARALQRESVGDDHPKFALTLVSLAAVYVEQDRPHAAISLLELALSIQNRFPIDPAAKSRTKFALAKAITEADGDRQRALRLARESLMPLANAGKRTKALHRQVQTWLKQSQ